MIAVIATLAIVLALALVLLHLRNAELEETTAALAPWKMRALRAEWELAALTTPDEEPAYVPFATRPFVYVPAHHRKHPGPEKRREFDPIVVLAAQQRIDAARALYAAKETK